MVDGDVQEGTTQGDPQAMPMYGLATIPIIRKLDGICTQIWYTDDSAAIGYLDAWWIKLVEVGPAFGQPSQNVACHKTISLQPGY